MSYARATLSGAADTIDYTILTDTGLHGGPRLLITLRTRQKRGIQKRERERKLTLVGAMGEMTGGEMMVYDRQK